VNWRKEEEEEKKLRLTLIPILKESFGIKSIVAATYRVNIALDINN
jgi:hypothetical protein